MAQGATDKDDCTAPAIAVGPKHKFALTVSGDCRPILITAAFLTQRARG